MSTTPAPTPPPMPPLEPHYQRTNHILHLILTVLTIGAWLPVWGLVYIINEVSNQGKRRHYDEARQQYNHAYWTWQNNGGYPPMPIPPKQTL